MEHTIWFTSDLHLAHDREFLYKPRGFECISDMNEVIRENWNNVVGEEDEVYVLGDLMLNDNECGIDYIKSLKGMIHVILGNHDTAARIELYSKCPNIVSIEYATVIKYGKYHFYLSHYPTMTSNLEKEHLSQCLINLYGHTHQQTNFYNDIPFMYHVGMDSHNCTPISIEQIIEDCKAKVLECKEML